MESSVMESFEQAIEPYREELLTRTFVVQPDLLEEVDHHLTSILPGRSWLLVADQTTYTVAGETVEQVLRSAGIQTVVHRVEQNEQEGIPVCDEASIRSLQQTGENHGAAPFDAMVAIGSGTVNDIAKMASFKLDIPYVIVATAPSVNGYTSSASAILSEGVKTTQPCDPPVAVLGDVNVLAEAPYRMIASGFGDLMSKPVSHADWMLSSAVGEGSFDERVAKVTRKSHDLVVDYAGRLPDREPEAITRLMASLLLSGIGMYIAGTSAPASGSEHLISHYLDMTHYAHGYPHDFHGCQVGVGTVTAAALYEQLLERDPSTIDVGGCVEQFPEWDRYSRNIPRRFGSLERAVRSHARNAHPTAETLEERLSQIKEDWSSIRNRLESTLRPAGEIQNWLEAARCPTRFDQIGVTPERAMMAVKYSRDIRDRYTILHLGRELGTIEPWTHRVLKEFHGIDLSAG